MRKQIGNKTVLSGAWRSALFPERPERRTRRRRNRHPSACGRLHGASGGRPRSSSRKRCPCRGRYRTAPRCAAACRRGADAVGQGGDRYGLVADDGDVAGDGRVLWQRRIGLFRQLQGQQGREVQLCGENLAVNAVAAGHERMDLAEAARGRRPPTLTRAQRPGWNVGSCFSAV